MIERNKQNKQYNVANDKRKNRAEKNETIIKKVNQIRVINMYVDMKSINAS